MKQGDNSGLDLEVALPSEKGCWVSVPFPDCDGNK